MGFRTGLGSLRVLEFRCSGLVWKCFGAQVEGPVAAAPTKPTSSALQGFVGIRV